METDLDLERLEREYLASGRDLLLLEANLRMTPDERVRAHEDAVALAEALRQGVDDFYARLREPGSAAD